MTPTVEHLGEDVLLLRFGDGIDTSTNARVHACAARLRQAAPGWVRDIVPAYATLAVFVATADMDRHEDPLAEAQAWAVAACGHAPAAAAPPGDARMVEVPVRFGGEDGPDLAEIARATHLPEAAVVERFCAATYQVAMLGFAPGFPYLLGLDPTLAMPRLDTPRTRVPGGSVAIGGAQAGIYPREGPGGWRLLGRTPRTLFDPSGSPPALLVPGDGVRFVPAE